MGECICWALYVLWVCVFVGHAVFYWYFGILAGPVNSIQFHDSTGNQAGVSEFTWTDSNKRLGLGTSDPRQPLHVNVNGTSGYTNIVPAGILITSNVSANLIFENVASTSGSRVLGFDYNNDGLHVNALEDDGTLQTANLFQIAHNGKISIGNEIDAPSALLQMVSTTRGVLDPRMDTTAETAISAPATGLQLTNTTLNRMRYFDGAIYQSLAFLSDIGGALDNIYNADDSLTGNRILTQAGFDLTFTGTTGAFNVQGDNISERFSVIRASGTTTSFVVNTTLNQVGIGIQNGDTRNRLHISTFIATSGITAQDTGILITSDLAATIVLEDAGETATNKVFSINYSNQALRFGSLNDAGSAPDIADILTLNRNGDAAFISTVTGTSFNGVSLTTGGLATNFLNEQGNYVAGPGAANTIYSADDSLTGNRNVGMAGFNLAFTGGGNVGIGQATPTFNLDILNASAPATLNLQSTFGGASICMDRNATTNEGSVQFLTSGVLDWLIGTDNLPSGNASDFAIKSDDNDPAEFIIQAGTGFVGINEVAPQDLLHVTKADTGLTALNSNVIIEDSNGLNLLTFLGGASTVQGIVAGSALDASDGGILYDNNARGWLFRTNGNVTRMLLDSLGDLGVGTTSPLHRAHFSTAGTTATPGWSSPSTDRGIMVSDSVGPRVMWDCTGEDENERIMVAKFEDGVFGFSLINDAGTAFTTAGLLNITPATGLVEVGDGDLSTTQGRYGSTTNFNTSRATSLTTRRSHYNLTGHTGDTILTVSQTDIASASSSSNWEFTAKDRTGTLVANGRKLIVKNEDITIDSVAVGASGSNFTASANHNLLLGDFVYHTTFTDASYNSDDIFDVFEVTLIVSPTVYQVADIPFNATDAGNSVNAIEKAGQLEITSDFGFAKLAADGNNLFTVGL